MENLAKKKQWNLIAHGSLLLFTLICIAVVWWSVGLRLPLLQQDSEEMRQVNLLQNRVEQARLQNSVSIERSILERTEAHKKEMFSDRKSIVDWLRQQIDIAQQQGIAFRYVLGGIGQALITHHAMTVKLHLAVTRVSSQGAYAQLIAFMDRVRRNSVALHINQLSMKGGGHGVTTMDVQITLWML